MTGSPRPPVLPVDIRPMTAADIPAVEVIEAAGFPELDHPSPFTTELGSKLSRYFVAVVRNGDGEEVVGYAGLWFVLDEAHITSVAVRPDLQRRGVARQLLLAACDAALVRECILLTLEVRASNSAAQRLYEWFGMRKVGIRKHYYSDNREDAWLMTIEGLQTPGFREHLERLRAGPPVTREGTC